MKLRPMLVTSGALRPDQARFAFEVKWDGFRAWIDASPERVDISSRRGYDHTDQSDKEEPIHAPYEDSVDRRIGNYRFRYDGPNLAKPGPRTRRLARQAHKSYWALVSVYDARGYTGKVHRITKRQLKRGANALADLLSTL